MSQAGMVFISTNHFRGSEIVVEEFERGIKEFSMKKPEKRVLCACFGPSQEIGRQIGKYIEIKPSESRFLDSVGNKEAMLQFIKNYKMACVNGELVYVVIDFDQMKYIRENYEDLACYFIGNRYGIK